MKDTYNKLWIQIINANYSHITRTLAGTVRVSFVLVRLVYDGTISRSLWYRQFQLTAPRLNFIDALTAHAYHRSYKLLATD